MLKGKRGLQHHPFVYLLSQVNPLNSLVEKIIFRNVIGINRTSHNELAPHCSTVDHFDQIYKVLLCFEASYKFGVIWRPKYKHKTKVEL